MPSLGVSSLDSGRSSERPPFFENPLCNVRKRTRKGGQGGFFRPPLTFYVCNTNPFGAKAHQGPPASQSSAYARPHPREDERVATNFREGAHPQSGAEGDAKISHSRRKCTSTRFCCASGLLPIAFCAAHHILGNAATCRRMPSLGVSSLDSGRSSERPPFLTTLLVTYGSGRKKGGRRFSSGPHSHFTSAILTHSARRGSRALPLRNLPRTRDLTRETPGESPQIFHRQPNTAPDH